MTDRTIVNVAYTIAVIGSVSWIRITSRARAERVDNPPQNPQVRASLMCGGILVFV